jgi:uncharacterized membrane protein YadS
VKEYIVWIATSLLALITPVQEYIITCEILIVLNWIADKYVKINHKKKHKKRSVPVYAQLFFVTTTILIAKWVDDKFLNTSNASYTLSLALVLFELGLFYKNISIIIGFDITQFLKNKK